MSDMTTHSLDIQIISFSIIPAARRYIDRCGYPHLIILDGAVRLVNGKELSGGVVYTGLEERRMICYHYLITEDVDTLS